MLSELFQSLLAGKVVDRYYDSATARSPSRSRSRAYAAQGETVVQGETGIAECCATADAEQCMTYIGCPSQVDTCEGCDNSHDRPCDSVVPAVCPDPNQNHPKTNRA